MKKVLLGTVSVFIFLAGCASTSKPVKEKDVPDWYLNPPRMEGKFIGVGDASRPQISLSRTVATTRAKAEIARAVDDKVSTMVKDAMSASGVGPSASSTEFTEAVTKSVSSIALKGCQVDKTEIHNGTVYVMVVYDAEKAKAEAKKAVEAAAKKDEALYNEFKARQAFDALDEEIDNMGTY